MLGKLLRLATSGWPVDCTNLTTTGSTGEVTFMLVFQSSHDCIIFMFWLRTSGYQCLHASHFHDCEWSRLNHLIMTVTSRAWRLNCGQCRPCLRFRACGWGCVGWKAPCSRKGWGWFIKLTWLALLSLYYILQGASQWQCHQTRLLLLFLWLHHIFMIASSHLMIAPYICTCCLMICIYILIASSDPCFDLFMNARLPYDRLVNILYLHYWDSIQND